MEKTDRTSCNMRPIVKVRSVLRMFFLIKGFRLHFLLIGNTMHKKLQHIFKELLFLADIMLLQDGRMNHFIHFLNQYIN